MTDETAPPTVTRKTPGTLARRYWWVIGLVLAALIVVVAAPRASSSPDGLERVAEDQQFSDRAEGSHYQWLPDYSVPGLSGESSTVAAGLIGVGIVVGLTVGIGWGVSHRKRPAR